jgi:regulatory protein RepA
MAKRNDTPARPVPDTPTPPAPQADVIPWLPVAQYLEETPPPLDHVLPGLLKGTAGGLVGSGGTGKSLLTGAIAVAIASNMSMNPKDKARGFPVAGGLFPPPTGGRVLWLSAEDPAEVIWHRLAAWSWGIDQKEMDPDWSLRARVSAHLHVASLVGHRPAIMTPECEPTQWRDAIAQQAIIDKARLIIIDPVSRFFGGSDENSNAQATAFVQHLEWIAKTSGAAVLAVHHVNKAAALNGGTLAAGQGAARGASAFVDGWRWMINVATMTTEEAKALGISEDEAWQYAGTASSKTNWGASFGKKWLRKVAPGRDETGIDGAYMEFVEIGVSTGGVGGVGHRELQAPKTAKMVNGGNW